MNSFHRGDEPLITSIQRVNLHVVLLSYVKTENQHLNLPIEINNVYGGNYDGEILIGAPKNEDENAFDIRMGYEKA